MSLSGWWRDADLNGLPLEKEAKVKETNSPPAAPYRAPGHRLPGAAVFASCQLRYLQGDISRGALSSRWRARPDSNRHSPAVPAGVFPKTPLARVAATRGGG